MEVHHHAHTHPKGTGRKKWTHYFWEFLMLFLAVFCGFLAENQREHFIEHQREKQFMKSLVKDLESDTAQSTQAMQGMIRIKIAMDSVIQLLRDPQIFTNSRPVYDIWKRNIGFGDFFSNDRTIQQLKSSGSLRLIRNKQVSDSIMQYDRTVRDYYGQDDLMSRVLTDQSQYLRLFDFIALDDPLEKDKPIALPADSREQLNEAYAYCKLWSFGLTALIRRLKTVQETAIRTLALVKDEYRIK